MKHARRPDRALVLRAQVLLAASIPWVVTRVVAPDQLMWSVAVVALTVVFALMRRSDPRVWLLPVNAVTCSAQVVPDAVPAVTSVVVGLFLLVDPPREQVNWPKPVRWLAVSVLAVVAVGIAASSFLTQRAGDAEFTAAQQQAAEAWDAPLIGVPESDVPESTPSSDDTATTATDNPQVTPTNTDTAQEREVTFAKMSFSRPSEDVPPVTSSSLFISPGISEADLTRGPGHYPQTAKPGADGNFAVAGHRTGWGAPFAALDDLQAGDIVSVENREGDTFDYEVVRSEIVNPDEMWVIGDDPLGTGAPTLTLTTCDPPGINTKRLIVWAELITSA